MAVSWIATGFKGVRYYEHPTRKVSVGVIKYKDKYFAIRYQHNGKRIEEGLGWWSDPDAWTAEKAFTKLVALKEAAKKSLDAPKRLKDERERNAEDELARLDARKLKGVEQKRLEHENITTERYFTDTYLPTVKTHRKSPDKICDEQHYRIWLAPVIASKPLKDVAPFDLERIKRNMMESGRSPRMVQYVFATFRQVWNMAIRDKILSGDSPTKSVKLPKVDNKRFRYLTKKEANLLLAALQQQDLATYRMATISLYTGMRADEVFSLTWGDVDTEKEHLRIRDPKNSESRYAYITSPVKTIIDAMTHGKPSDILFPNANGEKYSDTPFAYRTVVKALKFNDGITDPLNRVCFHTLRHTFGSWLAESGAELYTIGKLLGHKTLAMTARYAHLGPNTQRAAAKLLENLQDTLHEDSNQEVAA